MRYIKKKITQIFFTVILIGVGVTINSCSTLRLPEPGQSISGKGIKQNKKPRIIQLGPTDCPWDQNYMIKNKRDKNTYGAKYARELNKNLEPALE